MDIAINTLAGISAAEIVAAFNHSFSTYVIPWNMSEDDFKFKMKAEGIVPEYCAGAFHNGKLVGLILQGVDEIDGEKHVFNAGTGVAPEFRGNGLTEKMYNYILRVLKDKGYRHHRLEVLCDNIAAKKSYEKVGFKVVREIASFKGNGKETTNENIKIATIDVPDWHLMKTFWNIMPSWQNDTHSIIRAGERYKALGAYIDGNLAGYAIYDPKLSRIRLFGVKKEHRRQGIATALFSRAAKEMDGISFTNYDLSDKESIAAFTAMGLEPAHPSYEMKLHF